MFTGCLAENIGSERVMQKCGLIKEAEHIDYEWHDGKMKTRLEYRLLDYIVPKSLSPASPRPGTI